MSKYKVGDVVLLKNGQKPVTIHKTFVFNITFDTIQWLDMYFFFVDGIEKSCFGFDIVGKVVGNRLIKNNTI